MDYLVTWKIDIDAASPEEAARKAFEIQRSPESIAKYFEIQKRDKGGLVERRVFKVDLQEIPSER